MEMSNWIWTVGRALVIICLFLLDLIHKKWKFFFFKSWNYVLNLKIMEIYTVYVIGAF